jgi:RNA polymerase sigma factor (sigma-70 family)
MLSAIEMDTMVTERRMLVRFCASLTDCPDVAEDLAQLVLLDAWRHGAQLRDPQARSAWLLQIARNRCLAWGRLRGRERGRLQGGTANEIDSLVAPYDLEIDLERDELALLLDRALGLLPQETRDVLIRRYVEESSQAEIAARMSISEGAVEARLHRGRLALRRALTNQLSREAVDFGLIDDGDVGWTVTRIWCPGCGVKRLLGRLDPVAGTLELRCAGCVFPYNEYINASGHELLDARTVKPALSRVLDSIHSMFHVELIDARYRCHLCGDTLPVRDETEQCIGLACARCGWWDVESLHSLSWSLPEVRAFWRDHPRMRFLGARQIESGGEPAAVTGFESVDDGSRIEVVMLRGSLQVVHIARSSRRL